jgi:hypothetical protein
VSRWPKIKANLNLFKPETKNQTKIRPNQTKKVNTEARIREPENGRAAAVAAPPAAV